MKIVARLVAVALAVASWGVIAVAAPASAAPVNLDVQLEQGRVSSVVAQPDGGADLGFTNGQHVVLNESQYEIWRQSSQAVAYESRGPLGRYIPDNKVDGNCGSAYVYIAAVSGVHKAHVATGWITKSPSIEFNWVVSVLDDYGVSAHPFGGVILPTRTWAGDFSFTASGPTIATASVVVGPSWALTQFQGVCFAGAATASARIP